MINAVDYIVDRFGLDGSSQPPIQIPYFGRVGLASLFHKLGFNSGAEIGVCDGGYSKIICDANPDAKVYGVDPFVAYKDYHDYEKKSTIDGYHEKAKATLAPYKNYTLIEKFSMDAVKDFEDGSLDFVYIDANHCDPYITEDIREWSKKVRSGGIVSGHDYVELKASRHFNDPYDVVPAVHKFVADNKIGLWFITTYSPTVPEIEKRRSWIIVKP